MKSVPHRVLASLMALLLLASTTSWTVDKHYCMGHLQDVALFSNAESCGMAMEGSDVLSISENTDSCCNDVVVVINGQNDLKQVTNDIGVDHQSFYTFNTHPFDVLTPLVGQRMATQKHYPPPLLVKNIQLLDQVFLI
jgi:hypothetical protein